ncbi:IclR family transcriptional regulator [Amycolatopsis antarctica]|uniref:Glycerol operon regulatory protein n=1 Tax=Amycolatopsis antarctica TaxID=1854586 RepID=A0A263CVI7_9PSEU|nr:IclR family transcriptional regulator C-terminal domain-containing protein [Amycolatopsis antarctica]OZM70121.1 IclR family transcriptional regulator [Amycolatopsis antarctica]
MDTDAGAAGVDTEADTGAEPGAGGNEGAGEVRGAHHVQSLERGLAVIRAFDAGHRELTLSEVARGTGLTRAAARRFLLTLADLGYVRTDGKYFALTARVLELGYSYLSGMTLPGLAQPHLEALSAEVGESSSVAVLDGNDIVYVSRAGVARIMTVAINVGTRLPAHATSMGHVLLAGLPHAELTGYLEVARLIRHTPRTLTEPERLRAELAVVRGQGWALVDQELEQGLRSVAAPVRDRAGRVIAAVNLSTHASRTTVAEVRRDLVPPLLTAAGRIEADLALAPPGRVRRQR